MTRILLLLWLFLHIVFSAKANQKPLRKLELDQCGEGQEFVCLVRDTCTGSGNHDELEMTKKGAPNYENFNNKPECDMRIMMKQYNISSYLIRLITPHGEAKFVQDQASFGCRLDNGEPKEFETDSNMHLTLVYSEKQKDGMYCEFVVTHSNGEEVFPDNASKVTVEYNANKQLTSKETVQMLKDQLKKTTYRCDPGTLQIHDSSFSTGGYALRSVIAYTGDTVDCAAGYDMVFKGSEGPHEAESITCEKEEQGDDWVYKVKPKETKVSVPGQFYATCRRKICKMCTKPTDTELQFDPQDDCNTLKCKFTNTKNESIVSLNGDEKKKELGEFECTLDENEKPQWTFKQQLYTSVKCHDKLDCDLPKEKCTEGNGDDCRAFIIKPGNLTCPDGYGLEITTKDETDHPADIHCDGNNGIYHYLTKHGSTHPLQSTDQVMCAKKDRIAEAAGMQLWQILLVIGVVVVIIALIILVLLCLRRSRKADAEKRALLKKESTPSSTDSNKPTANKPSMQPSTAQQISSEQISEGTAKEKTKKEEQPVIEKTMIEPTLDAKTAASVDRTALSRQSKRETGSVETEVMQKGTHSLDRIPDMDEEAPDSKVESKVESKVSKKPTKEADAKKPRKFELNDKEKQIAKGVWRKNDDYPTMADIESDWDDEKDGKPPGKKRTATKDIPTADTPSARGAKFKGAELNEKTAEMERLLDQPTLKLQRVSSEESKGGGGAPEAASRGTDSRASIRKTANKMSNVMTTLDITQEQKL